MRVPELLRPLPPGSSPYQSKRRAGQRPVSGPRTEQGNEEGRRRIGSSLGPSPSAAICKKTPTHPSTHPPTIPLMPSRRMIRRAVSRAPLASPLLLPPTCPYVETCGVDCVSNSSRASPHSLCVGGNWGYCFWWGRGISNGKQLHNVQSVVTNV